MIEVEEISEDAIPVPVWEQLTPSTPYPIERHDSDEPTDVYRVLEVESWEEDTDVHFIPSV